MTISNELSSEIAMALLCSRHASSLAPDDLKRVVEQVHETLKLMDNENRKPRALAASATSTPIQKLD